MFMMNTTEPEPFRWILKNLRPEDRRELAAVRRSDDLLQIAREVEHWGSFSFVAGDHEPIAAIGAMPMWPGVWSVWMFATERFPRIGLPLTRWVRRRMIPALYANEAHRAECRCLADYVCAREWLEVLGARQESTLKGYGRNGEDFCCYVWGRDDVHA